MSTYLELNISSLSVKNSYVNYWQNRLQVIATATNSERRRLAYDRGEKKWLCHLFFSLPLTACNHMILTMLRIVADENIPFVKEIFADFGEVSTLPGRAINNSILTHADVLLVRSITPVTPALLDGTGVGFVGTATIGTDHIDKKLLQNKRIAFADAAGSNSNSVAEYVITALLVLAERHNWDLRQKSLGIIGFGNIGSIVNRYARALGMATLLNDPPLQRIIHNKRFVPLDDALQADFITLHTPLTRDGPHPTFHLLDKKHLNQLKPSAVLINTSRGPVLDNSTLRNLLESNRITAAVLDVWENEPDIDLDLLNRTDIATPHIAGYSLDGKVNGTLMLHSALCSFLNLHKKPRIEPLMPAPPLTDITLDTTTDDAQTLITHAMKSIYDLEGDDRRLREITQLPPNLWAPFYDKLRKNYPLRREAHNTRIHLQPTTAALADQFAQLGFKMA